jgi:hypothetical protein
MGRGISRVKVRLGNKRGVSELEKTKNKWNEMYAKAKNMRVESLFGLVRRRVKCKMQTDLFLSFNKTAQCTTALLKLVKYDRTLF